MELFRKKKSLESVDAESSLVQCLTLFDLIFLGIGAIIGAGIFILTGIVAATQAGPAIVISYVLAGFAAAFAAFSYAELASSLGGCGSAYGYAYAGFGELIAWIVGWDLLLEYTISVSAVSVGWSQYVGDFLLAMNVHVPQHLLYIPWNGEDLNVLAVFIVAILTLLLIKGVKISAQFNNVIVLIKLAVIFLFIAIASTHIQTDNWTHFMPFGWTGVIEGASLIFFAYVGFDAVSTAAEEAINPQRDLPLGIIYSLALCTLLYIVVSGLLTGMIHYSKLNVASPISHSLILLGHKMGAACIGVGAIGGLTTTMLVLYYGLTRVFLAMSRDGLLPHVFAKIHPWTKTPIRIILLCGLIISSFSAFLPLGELAQLVNIGTLFAFIIVCAGVLYLRKTHPHLHRPFKIPGMPWVPLLGIISCSYLLVHLSKLTFLRFGIWMILGLIIYFIFGQKNSKMNQQ